MATTRAVKASRKFTESGWDVAVSWEVIGDRPASDGPTEVTMKLSPDATDAQRRKGWTTGVARRIERRIAMLALPEGVQRISERNVRQMLQDGVAKMPASPKDDPDTYYAALLDLLQKLESAGLHVRPIDLLAEVMGVPVGTVKSRIYSAKLHRNALTHEEA
ncbi:hypothetical protein ACL02O_14745 [Micromonospora sp. MS34]|uniref:hypothetical protein n=1 Tax=Micromonospora sp. MS34 TaxID=3385971 RepID=UPI0039A15C74